MSDDDNEVIDCELITQIANEAIAIEIKLLESFKSKGVEGDSPFAKPKSGTPEYRRWYYVNKLTPEKKEKYRIKAREKEKALHALLRSVWLP